ncbi:NAD(P)H:quinone oxidoreductase [Paenibacillus qinlingensis]|uniref:NAD(P)H:quinone oxidoreductase n=1 Tax=Paenibacillus qinlingensis TaxID=1837343 RepID=UPI0015642B2A|nr:NAD(P)H:quinone oxidoreductase [Paenibacillus qinlingensis]NQX58032.1 NAD(P)H:quinone oxidoreductase [Paenibacillus qinlingensis]
MGFFKKLFTKETTNTAMTTKVNLAIIYYSSNGTNYQLAQWAAEGARQAGAEVKILKVAETAPQSVVDGQPSWKAHLEATKNVPTATVEDLEWADAIIFSMPTRFGNLPAQLKQFLDTTGGLWAQGKTVNKVVSAMTSATNPNAGQEQTILQLYTSMYHWGAIVAAPGFTDQSVFTAGGNPYGTSVTVGQDGKIKEDARGAAEHQAKRTVSIAKALKIGNEQQQ